MAHDAAAAAKELHDKGYERVPAVCEKKLLQDAPSLAPALTDPNFVHEVDERLSQLWPPNDTWKRFAR